MAFPTAVKMVEVGPRDGLQNEPKLVPTSTKVEFINRLSRTGLSVIEVTSFVSSQWIPQLADHREVMQQIEQIPPIRYPVLVPNLRGLKEAMATGVKEIAIFTAASESFVKRNINCSIDESFNRFAPVIEIAQKKAIPVRGYLSCALGCPFEGEISVHAVVTIAKRLATLGCYEISVADTIGVGTPQKAKQVFEALAAELPLEKLAAHFHNTYGQAIANIYALLEMGIHIFDSAVAGLGGCPYARGATGNVASEDVLYLLNGLGIQTGVDLDKLIAVGHFITTTMGRVNDSKVGRARATAQIQP